MKNKYFILLTMSVAFCLLGCSCKGDDPQDSSVDDSSSSTETVYDEAGTVVSVNQKSVTISVGESFTLVADAKDVEAPTYLWTVDGDSASDVVSVTQTGNAAAITALKAGQTKLVVSVQHDGYTYFQTVDVTVNEDSGVRLVLSDNIGFNDNGYYARLSTLSTDNGDLTSIVSTVSAYKDNKIVGASNVTWESSDTSIVTTDGNTFISGKEGNATVIGSCTVDGETYTVEVAVEVYRPTVALEESFVIERESLSPLTVSSPVKGLARDVLYNGQSVGTFNAQSGVVTLSKELLPGVSAQMGENRTMSIETDLASYTFNVDLYTKIISNKEEFEELASLAKLACPTEPALWDGYFILDNDIAYNGQFHSKIADLDSLWAAVGGAWSNGGLYGFKGVFDGKGHNIEGIAIDNGSSMGSVFGVLHIDGVVKNLSFTKASVAANSSLVCHAGGGTVENIFIQYDSIGKGTQHYEGNGSINSHCGSFFSFKEPTPTANVSNCVIDVTNATVNANASIKLVGSEYASIKNVFVIGGTEDLQNNANATLAFPAVIDFVEDVNAQKRYSKFDEDFWALAGGVPVSNAVYEQISDRDVQFAETVSYLVAGTSYQFLLSNSYVSIESSSDSVAISGNVATVSPSAQNGEQVVITAKSIFNEEITVSFTCAISVADVANAVDLTGEQETAFYDITEGKVYFAELSSKITGEVLYFVNPDYSTATYLNDGEGVQQIVAVTKEKLYKFNCLSVTKVLTKAEDLHYLRRDYTVSSYGNKGCYDGVLSGTFVMINDIDCTDLQLKDSGGYWENSRGFAGVLDGRGYTVSNLSVSQNGLFGAMAYATVKNVSFTNVKLKAQSQGSGVALFANRMFNTVMENVSMHFAEVVASDTIYNTSGLMFHDVSFDCTFKNITIDISKVSGVKFLTECLYDENAPYKSEKKSVYENVTVIVANLNQKPAFAYNSDYSEVAYPDGAFTFEEATV